MIQLLGGQLENGRKRDQQLFDVETFINTNAGQMGFNERMMNLFKDYIECVLRYENELNRELENNLEIICDQFAITREEFKQS